MTERSEWRVAAVLAAFVSASCAGTGPAGSSRVSEGKTPPLVGTTWRLVSIEGHEPLPGIGVTALFEEQSRVSGSAGCNRYFGAATVRGNRLEVGPLATTRMHCGEPGVMPQEAAYLSALAKSAVYRLAGRQLELGPAAGAITLVFFAD